MLFLFAILLVCPAAARAPIGPGASAAAILDQAVAAMGGETWLNPRTLILEGSATFYGPDGAIPRSRADDYRMWRAMDPGRTVAHGADGKVRILARSSGTRQFEVGYDGVTTWTDKGVMPKVEADRYWASNFGFGIIRRARGPGFRLERAPDRSVDGHPLAVIRAIDPTGGKTMFGIDRASRLVRYMAFDSPRGFHERIYDDFVAMTAPRWVQARSVTLFYDGVMANSVRWTRARVNAAIDSSTFAPPATLPSPALQPRTPMPAYLIIKCRIHDRQRFIDGYGREAGKLVAKFGGEYVVRAPGAVTLEGKEADGLSVVVSRWPDAAAARAFWNSPEYAVVRSLREGVADCEVLLVEQP